MVAPLGPFQPQELPSPQVEYQPFQCWSRQELDHQQVLKAEPEAVGLLTEHPVRDPRLRDGWQPRNGEYVGSSKRYEGRSHKNVR
ncbi:hypothetical protein [Synechococcus sp. CC9902]|uniref:hypothetical protein n=1 Tax=Synechococcus sp. (strain CC9902) TaxID=316279 RepID=UPI001E441A71|nr:hypothetical protein [Synechococcus sp. CC9902]